GLLSAVKGVLKGAGKNVAGSLMDKLKCKLFGGC
uniref:Brevinin-2DYa n=1 Tax=Rana dybowskii TaxID=71582 RepID=BR2A_RANDY|nr:RecName: Full=Brevinin-2DYa [Rana dybowskii]